MKKLRLTMRHIHTITCNYCHEEKPETDFELMKTGTRRHVCNHCKYLYYTRPAYLRRVARQCTHKPL